MKRVLSMLMVIVLLFGLSACGEKKTEDGTYSIDVTLTGGTGRASIEDATVVITGDKAEATIVWSSPHYEYMLIEDTKYEPVQTSGNSTFVIPVTLDTEIPVSALTVAMSEPHLIDYTLLFDSSTMRSK